MRLEQMGGLPEYNKAEWDALKQQEGTAFIINQGKKMGVPQEELDRFAQDIIARETKKGNHDWVYRFKKNMGIGTEKEVRDDGKRAYNTLFGRGIFDSAMNVAKDVYGDDSEEWKRANEVNEIKQKEAEKMRKEKKVEDEEDEGRKLEVVISKDATFADLFDAISIIESEEGFDALPFEEELWDNFGNEITDEVLAFRDERVNEAKTTKVLDFFKECGYSQSDVSVFLPIKFRRERKKK